MISSTGWTRFNSKKNPCPVCQGERKDCRQSEETGLIFCRTGIQVSGWDSVGEDRNGFYLYRAGNTESNSVRIKKSDPVYSYREMLVSERDRIYRQILSGLTIAKPEQDNLLSRGLSQEKIKELAKRGFKTVYRWHGVNFDLPTNLPGKGKGKSLTAFSPGLLCPVPNYLGEIQGFQVRRRTVEPGDCRYYWLSKSKTIEDGAQPRVKGEWPIGVYEPLTGEINARIVYLVEGFLKAQIVAELSGCICLGAVGGNFALAPNLLQEAIAHIQRDYPDAQFVFLPDAGAVQNRTQSRIYESSFEAITDCGVNLSIGWWGQVEKGEPLDPDEVDPALYRLGGLKLLSIEEYRAIREEYKGGNESTPLYLSASETKALEQERLRYKLNSLSIQADIEISERYLPDLPFPEPGEILVVSSPCGTGKTEFNIRMINEHRRRYPNSHRNLLFYRNGLAYQTIIRVNSKSHDYWTVQHVLDTNLGDSNLTETYRRSLTDKAGCIDSIERMIDVDDIPPNSLLVLDETDALLKHALEGGTLKGRQAEALAYFLKVLKTVIAKDGFVLAGEAFLTDLPILLLQQIIEDIGGKLKFLVNSFQMPSWDVQLGTGCYSGLIPEINEQLRQGENVLLVSDSQGKLQDYEAIAHEQFPDLTIIRVDSETAELPETKEFQQNPDKVLEGTNGQILLLLSPTVESGLDISRYKGFKRVYGIFYHFSPRAAIQLLSRYREPVPRVIFCAGRAAGSEGKSFDPGKIEAELNIIYSQTVENSRIREELNLELEANPGNLEAIKRLQALDGEADNKQGKFWNRQMALFRAREIAVKSRLCQSLQEELVRQGHTITEVKWKVDPTVRKVFKDTKTKREAATATRIAQNLDWENIDPTQAQIILASPGATSDDRMSAKKAILNDQYPGAPLDDYDFVLKAVVENRGEMLRQARLYFYCKEPTVAEIIDRSSLSRQLSKPFIVKSKVSHLRGKVSVLQPIFPLLEAIAHKDRYGNSDSEPQAIREYAITHAEEVHRELNLNIKERQSPVEITNKLLKRLGFTTSEIARPGSKKRERKYAVTNLDCPYRKAIFEALRRKWETELPSEISKDTYSQEESIKNPDDSPNDLPKPSPDEVISELGLEGLDPNYIQTMVDCYLSIPFDVRDDLKEDIRMDAERQRQDQSN